MGLANPSNNKMRRNRSSRSKALMSEINVTPLVDVMLVLLIVFMVSAPLLVTGVPLELPKTKAGAVKIDGNPLTVSIDESGRYGVGNKYFTKLDNVIVQLRILTSHKESLALEPIFVRGAKNIPYEKILRLIAAVQQAGFTNVTLASLPQQ